MWYRPSEKRPAPFLICLLWADNGYYLGYIDDAGWWHYDCEKASVPDTPPSHWSKLIDEPQDDKSD